MEYLVFDSRRALRFHRAAFNGLHGEVASETFLVESHCLPALTAKTQVSVNLCHIVRRFDLTVFAVVRRVRRATMS